MKLKLNHDTMNSLWDEAREHGLSAPAYLSKLLDERYPKNKEANKNEQTHNTKK